MYGLVSPNAITRRTHRTRAHFLIFFTHVLRLYRELLINRQGVYGRGEIRRARLRDLLKPFPVRLQVQFSGLS